MKFQSNSLNEWLIYLESLHPEEIELGLDRLLTVFRRMRLGPIARRVVTIGGTNGKGTTLFALEQLLQGSEKRVGCYTSPHLDRFNERIRIAGEDVSDETLLRAFRCVEEARKSTALTYFEFTTLAALLVFSESALDYVLLEVGLGGRLDAVNIIDPDLSIITAVDLDHQAWLGETRELIGYEKAGIMRQGKIALYGEFDPPMSVLQQAQAQAIPLKVWGRDYGLYDASGKAYRAMNSCDLVNAIAEGGDCDVPVDFGFQAASGDLVSLRLNWPIIPVPVSNLATAIQAYLLLEEKVVEGKVVEGAVLEGNEPSKLMEQLSVLPHVPGRYQSIDSDTRLRFDVAHNGHAARYLNSLLRIEKARQGGNVIALFSVLRDKDIQSVIDALKNTVSLWVIWALDVPRAATVDQVSALLQASGCDYKVTQCATEALACANSVARESDTLAVFGSFYTVVAFQEALKIKEGAFDATEAE